MIDAAASRLLDLGDGREHADAAALLVGIEEVVDGGPPPWPDVEQADADQAVLDEVAGLDRFDDRSIERFDEALPFVALGGVGGLAREVTSVERVAIFGELGLALVDAHVAVLRERAALAAARPERRGRHA